MKFQKRLLIFPVVTSIYSNSLTFKPLILNTQFISRFCGCLLSILLISQTFAQKSDDKKLATLLYTKDVAGIGENGSTAGIENMNVNAKVSGAFEKSFEKATNVNWSGAGKDFLATFTTEGKERRALFNKNGRVLYIINYGTEKDLSAETRKLVKGAYVDYSIASAIEVREDNRTIWLVKLEDSLNLVFVRVENREMEETKHYQKAK